MNHCAIRFCTWYQAITEKFTLKVVTNERTKNVFLRMKPEQEMAHVHEEPRKPTTTRCLSHCNKEEVGDNFGDTDVEGTVYMITSLRPDIYEKNSQSSKNTFKIEGRVDENIKAIRSTTSTLPIHASALLCLGRRRLCSLSACSHQTL